MPRPSIPPRTPKAPWWAISCHLLGTTLIFATDLHHLAIGAIAGSYRMLPPGGHLPTADMAQLVIQLVSSSFALGFQLAAPFLVFGFAVYAALGVLARLMPQLQIFFVAVPINIMCGFLIMLALIGSMMTVFLNYYTTSDGAVSSSRKPWLTTRTNPSRPKSRHKSGWNRRAKPATSSNPPKSPPSCFWRGGTLAIAMFGQSTAVGLAELLTHVHRTARTDERGWRRPAGDDARHACCSWRMILAPFFA